MNPKPTPFLRFVLMACWNNQILFAVIAFNLILSLSSADYHGAMGWLSAAIALGLFSAEQVLRREWEEVAASWKDACVHREKVANSEDLTDQ